MLLHMSFFFCNFVRKIADKPMTMVIVYSIFLVLVMIFGFWFIQNSAYRNEEKKRLFELKKDSQKVVSPIRLRAYERLALVLERTKPEHMLLELRSKEPDALNSWSVPEVQQYLLQTIRAEFDHNQSQQVYVSDEVWDQVVNARNQMATFVIAIAAQMPAEATTQTYVQTLLTAYSSNGLTPTDKALEALRDEAKSLM